MLRYTTPVIAHLAKEREKGLTVFSKETEDGTLHQFVF